MKIKLCIFITTLLLFSNKCESDDCHKTITFINNSDTDVYIHGSGNYPDTIGFYREFPNPIDSKMYKVPANSTNTSALWESSCLEYWYSSKKEVMMVYVFDKHVLEITPWETIGKEHLVLKRYNLSLDDLYRMNWVINYP